MFVEDFWIPLATWSAEITLISLLEICMFWICIALSKNYWIGVTRHLEHTDLYVPESCVCSRSNVLFKHHLYWLCLHCYMKDGQQALICPRDDRHHCLFIGWLFFFFSLCLGVLPLTLTQRELVITVQKRVMRWAYN